jgi:outer membrane protein OmpA-like peptidoglycan-associated protein
MAPSFRRLPPVYAASLIAGLGVCGFGLFGMTQAQAAANNCNGRLDAAQIVTCLRASPLATRGLRVSNAGAAPAASAGANLRIDFAFGSAALSDGATSTLDNLGRAVTDPSLKAATFEIAGHTDAVGTEAANKALSERRAAAVKDYIVGKYGIDAARLKTVGYGKTRLLDPDHPNSGVNRRVQITITAD